MRKYQAIWEELKKTMVCCLSADERHHPRIIKAVFKERDKDLAWKLERAESQTRFRLKASSNQAQLVFQLIPSKKLSVEDL